MRLYLAGPFQRQAEIRGFAELARVRGHEVTSRWIEPHNQDGPDPNYRRGEAMKDVVDIRLAEALIAFTEPEDSKTPPRGGRHWEVGFAWAEKKLIVVVPYRENVFHHLPDVWQAETFEEALDRIEALEE